MLTNLFSKLSFVVLSFVIIACNTKSGNTKQSQADTAKNSQADTASISQEDSKTGQEDSKSSQEDSKKNQNVPGSDTIRINGCQANQVRAKVGSTLELKLEAVPGSGYQWLQKEPSRLLKLLDPDNLKFTKPETKEPTPGAPGHQILHFKVVKDGSETLKLEYKRTWESELMNSCEMKIEVSKT